MSSFSVGKQYAQQIWVYKSRSRERNKAANREDIGGINQKHLVSLQGFPGLDLL